MNGDHNRYFIELQPDDGFDAVPRYREDETRREQAVLFIASVYNWLKNHDLSAKVSAIDVTVFGQVRITCEDEIIHRIRDEDRLNIASIRPGVMYVEGMSQIGRRG